LRAGDVALHLTQLGIAVEHILERGLRDTGRLLQNTRYMNVRGQLQIAGLGLHFAGKQVEQGRLAATVRTDDPDTLPGVKGEIDAGGKDAGAAGERQFA
jgi:hypothetical protein